MAKDKADKVCKAMMKMLDVQYRYHSERLNAKKWAKIQFDCMVDAFKEEGDFPHDYAVNLAREVCAVLPSVAGKPLTEDDGNWFKPEEDRNNSPDDFVKRTVIRPSRKRPT